MTKTYTLELTAEELEKLGDTKALGKCVAAQVKHDILDRVDRLTAQARADREQADLCLPWIAVESNAKNSWFVGHATPLPGGGNYALHSHQQVKLMSAAPELLEAVRGIQEWAKRWDGTVPEADLCWVLILVRSALHKVETGRRE